MSRKIKTEQLIRHRLVCNTHYVYLYKLELLNELENYLKDSTRYWKWRCFYNDYYTAEEFKNICDTYDFISSNALSKTGFIFSAMTMSLTEKGYFHWNNVYFNLMKINEKKNSVFSIRSISTNMRIAID